MVTHTHTIRHVAHAGELKGQNTTEFLFQTNISLSLNQLQR